MATIQIFNNSSFGEVRVAGTSDEPLFCLSDVCRVLDLGNASQVKSRLDDGVISNEVIIDSLGREQYATFLNEDGLYDVILDSRKPQAKAFRKWVTSEVLPSIRKHGEYSVRREKNIEPSLSDKMKVATWLIKTLNLNDASKLTLAKSIADPLGLPTPDYVPSKGILKSATELLREQGLSISAKTFNSKAMERGFLKDMTRNSSGGKLKHFKTITEKGKRFGENQVCPNNPKETQPLWYEAMFGELLRTLNLQLN